MKKCRLISFYLSTLLSGYYLSTSIFHSNNSNWGHSTSMLHTSGSVCNLYLSPCSSHADTDNKPRLSDLAHLGIINACSPVWRQLGGLLGLDTGKMDNFTKQALFDNVQCCERVFDHWINNDGFPPNYPLSWMTVYDVLCAIDRRKIADEMKEKLINKE